MDLLILLPQLPPQPLDLLFCCHLDRGGEGDVCNNLLYASSTGGVVWCVHRNTETQHVSQMIHVNGFVLSKNIINQTSACFYVVHHSIIFKYHDVLSTTLMVTTLKLFMPLKPTNPSTLAKLPSCLSHIKSRSKNFKFTIILSGPVNTITYVGDNLGSLSNNTKQAARNLAVILDFNLWIDYQFKECSCWWLGRFVIGWCTEIWKRLFLFLTWLLQWLQRDTLEGLPCACLPANVRQIENVISYF